MTALPLDIVSWGAVTAVGLTAPQTCAAIRANVRRFEPVLTITSIEDPFLGARAFNQPRLPRERSERLLELATRALRDCCDRMKLAPAATPLFLLLPDDLVRAARVADLEPRTRQQYSPSSSIVGGGAVAIVDVLEHARNLIARGEASHCLISAADSLVGREHVEHLRQAGRLYRSDNPQGMIPGEGSACLLVGRPSPSVPSLARIAGFGQGREANTVVGPSYSVGEGLRDAFEAALADAECSEPEIDFVCSTMNGERYAAMEAAYAHARCYRTRRERLRQIWPATSTGDIGVAAGLLAIIVAGTSMLRNWAEGSLAACEVASEGEQRGVLLLRKTTQMLGWYDRVSPTPMKSVES
jgi:3-oxoacyl-[acyl-carrier-protein] synthase-1